MELLLEQPLWLALVAVTLLVHVGFFVLIRRWIARDTKAAEHRDTKAAERGGASRDRAQTPPRDEHR